MFIRAPATLAAIALALSVAVFAQDSPSSQPTYRTGVDLVRVDVSVLDRDRHSVTGLKQGDFVLRVDGKVKPIAAFTAVALPDRQPEPSAAWMREVGPDVVTNLAPKEGRLVVILLDYSIRNADIPWARRTAHAAVDQLGPGDMAAVVYTSVGVPQNFTADRSLLRAAIDRPFLGIDVDPEDPFGSHRGECRCGVCSLEVMTNLADAVREVPHRRKMLLFIGSSVSVSTTNIECFAEVREAREKLLRAAGAANLTIHTFDSTLLESLGYSDSRVRDIPPVTDASARSPHLRRQLDLAFFPAETGGRAIKNTNAPWEPVPAIFAETESYYVLGFAPSSQENDGAFHKISVDVNRPGIEVHPRKGYYSTPPARADSTKPSSDGPPSSLMAAVKNLWPVTQIPMSVTVAAFANAGDPGATVAVVARAQEPVGQADPDGVARVNVMAGAYGRNGESLGTQVQTITIRSSGAGQKVFQYEIVSKLQLKAGRHEIRVAAEDPSRHLIGSVYTYAEVPDFARAPVSLSGVVLGLRSSRPDGPFRDLFPLEPTARREFASTSHVTAFVRVYQSERDGLLPVTLRRRILDASNHAVQESSEKIFESGNAATHTADYQFDLPLASLLAGQYLLTIEATRKGNQNARRDVVFAVR